MLWARVDQPPSRSGCHRPREVQGLTSAIDVATYLRAGPMRAVPDLDVCLAPVTDVGRGRWKPRWRAAFAVWQLTSSELLEPLWVGPSRVRATPQWPNSHRQRAFSYRPVPPSSRCSPVALAPLSSSSPR